MVVRIWHIIRRRRTTRKDIVEMISETRELLQNILHTYGKIAELICERIHITPNNTKICIKSIKVLHNRLMILLIVR
jgi:N-acetylglucosamine-6-phosphate deacetylase